MALIIVQAKLVNLIVWLSFNMLDILDIYFKFYLF